MVALSLELRRLRCRTHSGWLSSTGVFVVGAAFFNVTNDFSVVLVVVVRVPPGIVSTVVVVVDFPVGVLRLSGLSELLVLVVEDLRSLVEDLYSVVFSMLLRRSTESVCLSEGLRSGLVLWIYSVFSNWVDLEGLDALLVVCFEMYSSRVPSVIRRFTKRI